MRHTFSLLGLTALLAAAIALVMFVAPVLDSAATIVIPTIAALWLVTVSAALARSWMTGLSR